MPEPDFTSSYPFHGTVAGSTNTQFAWFDNGLVWLEGTFSPEQLEQILEQFQARGER